MAQSDEEIQLRGKARRRLVGAVGLALVAAVVLPLVLESKPKPMNQDIAIEIPKPGDSSLGAAVPARPPVAAPPAVTATPVPPTPDIPVSSPAPVAGAAPKPADKPVAKPTEKPASKPVEKPASKPVDKPAAKPAAPAKAPEKPAAGAFVIQVAALANADNAKQLQDKLSASGVKAYTDTVKGAHGTLTRVRVGPFGSREEADKALVGVKKLGVDGKVVPK
jgi:DedD protein